MKNILRTLILLNTIIGFSQEDAIIDLRLLGQIEEEVDKYYYYKDINNDLDKFLHTWKYEGDNIELIITFYLNQHIESGGDYYDEIYARFKYSENGSIIYDNLDDLSASKTKIFGSSISSNGREISLAYNEPTNISYTKSPNQNLTIEYLPCSGIGCSPQLQWKVFWTKSQDSDIWPFKIPAHLILIRIQ